jgi:hypothetical protein
MRPFRATVVAVEKQEMLHIMSVLVALGMHHAILMSLIVLSRGLSGSTIFFHTISLTVRFFERKKTEHKKCVLIFAATFA